MKLRAAQPDSAIARPATRRVRARGAACPEPAGTALPALPSWSRLTAGEATDLETALLSAGVALAALDGLIKAAPPWLGSLALRQALFSAEAGARRLRLGADELSLRDAIHWHRPGETMGEAGQWHALMRFAAMRRPEADDLLLQTIAERTGLVLGEAWPGAETGDAAGEIPDPLAGVPQANPVTLALAAGQEFFLRHAAAHDEPASLAALEMAAFLMADIALAQRLHWPRPLPLLTAALGDALFRDKAGRRILPDHPHWLGAAKAAFARALHACHDRARHLAVLAEALLAAKLRTRGKAGALRAILAEDCVKAGALTMLGSERAALRMLETLTKQGALRELTGRRVFRLYGL